MTTRPTKTMRAIRAVARASARNSPGVFALLNSGGDLALLQLAVRQAREARAWSVARVARVVINLERDVRVDVIRRVLDELAQVTPTQMRILALLAAAAAPMPASKMTAAGAGIGSPLRFLVESGHVSASSSTPPMYEITAAGRTAYRARRRR